jgi:site-specific recombinase XerD
MAVAGVSSGEAIAMQVGSVKAAERFPRLRVLGKGNRIPLIPVGPRAAVWISRWRNRNARSSNPLRRSQPVTSSLHLLVLHEPQAGATLSSVYRPPRESASTQSRCSGLPVAPQ